MIHHELEQGSAEWKTHRAKYFNASDAPAMLGLSKYKSRNELLSDCKTGFTKEVGEATQKRFDDGHRFEALARPVAEKIVGSDLYPVTGTHDVYGASFDGLTLAEDIAFEHKTLNKAIRECNSIDDLDEMYLVQMEQQLLVSGAEKCLFMASTWNAQNELVEETHFWYEANAKRRQTIIDGWNQFAIDLENYVPIEVVEKPKADVVIELPALFIQARGEIMTSNMKEYGTALANRLAEVRSIALVTDQDFSNAKSAASLLRDNIKQANLAKAAMLEQTATVGEAARMIDAWCEDMRLTALQLEKDVEREDKAKKLAMVNLAKGDFMEVINTLESKVRPIRLNIVMPNFEGAIKGKSKFASMQDAIDTLTANATAEASRLASDIAEKQEYMKVVAEDYGFLFADLQQIIFKADDDFKLLVTTRIKGQRESDEAKEEQIRQAAQAELLREQETEKVVVAEPKLSNLDMVNAATRAIPKGNVGALANALPTQYFAGTTPTENEMVTALSVAFKVDELIAHKWLITADFSKYVPHKQAA